MRRLTIRLTIALLTFMIGVGAAAFWFLYRRPAVQTLENPPCSRPPDYEMLSVPCSGVDLSAFSNLPLISYCDLVRDYKGFENKIIRVHGIYFSNMENSALNDPSCRCDDSSTWVEFEPYSNFNESMKVLDLVDRSKSWGVRRGEVVFLGKFYGASDKGYGHLNSYRFQLLVMNVEQVEPLRREGN